MARRRARGRDYGWVLYAGAGLAALMWASRKAAAAPSSPAGATVLATTPVILPPTPVPGAQAPNLTTTSVSAAIWQNLTPSAGPTSGYVNFPTGSQAAAVFLPWAADSAGNIYTTWAGQLYAVDSNPDSQGNHVAKLLGS